MQDGVVLCVDDDLTLLQALRALLSQHLGLKPGRQIEIAESGEEALELIEELGGQGRHLAVIISDYIMPGMRGDALLARVHQRWPDSLKIMLTGQSDLNGIKSAINNANLYRFLEKPFDHDDIVMTTRAALTAFQQARELERYCMALEAANQQLEAANQQLDAQVREQTAELRKRAELLEAQKRELEQKSQALERLSVTDALTGLPNRRALDEALSQELERALRYGQPMAVVILDIDHFKQVNDIHGHAMGDLVLRRFASLMAAQVRTNDLMGRWGGEEFLLLCPCTGTEGALALAEKLRALLAAHEFEGLGRRTASFGVATLSPGDTLQTLLSRADAALYEAKRRGRDCVQLAEPALVHDVASSASRPLQIGQGSRW